MLPFEVVPRGSLTTETAIPPQDSSGPRDRTSENSFRITEPGPTESMTHNVRGLEIRTLAEVTRARAVKCFTWDGTDKLGNAMPSDIFADLAQRRSPWRSRRRAVR